VRASEQLAETYSQMLTGAPVLEATIAELGLGESSQALAKRIKVALVPGTQLIKLRVTGADPAEVALITNTIPRLFVIRIQALEAERYAGP
jgi:capsular polysaccharide biosynthesis protein